jgi:hypothetical protein
VITHGACIGRGEKRFGYEVAGLNKRETDGDVKVVFGIAFYILVVCDRLCIAYIETRYLIVVEASCKQTLTRMESAITCLVYALLLCAFNKIVIETPDVLLILTCHWMDGMFSDVTYHIQHLPVVIARGLGVDVVRPWSGLTVAALASSLQYRDTLVN